VNIEEFLFKRISVGLINAFVFLSTAVKHTVREFGRSVLLIINNRYLLKVLRCVHMICLI